MSSNQNRLIKLVIGIMKNSLFIHKTQTTTHRKSFERVSRFTKFPRKVKQEATLIENMEASWFVPENEEDKKSVILYFHGGGYCVGSVNTHRALIARLARACKVRALAVNYRLAPECPFPAALEDALEAYQYLLNQGYEKIIVSGDSAGGGLSVALMLKMKDLNMDMPASSILISPWVDLTHSGETLRTKANVDPLIAPELLSVFSSKYVPEGDVTNPYISPLFGDLSGLPPTLIHVGSHEVLLDDSLRLAKRMYKSDVDIEIKVWDKQIHVFHWLGGLLPEAKKAFQDIGEFIQKKKLINSYPKKRLKKREKKKELVNK